MLMVYIIVGRVRDFSITIRYVLKTVIVERLSLDLREECERSFPNISGFGADTVSTDLYGRIRVCQVGSSYLFIGPSTVPL